MDHHPEEPVVPCFDEDDFDDTGDNFEDTDELYDTNDNFEDTDDDESMPPIEMRLLDIDDDFEDADGDGFMPGISIDGIRLLFLRLRIVDAIRRGEQPFLGLQDEVWEVLVYFELQ